MGAKGSKPEPKKLALSPGSLINILDETVFPKRVQDEFLKVKEQIPPIYKFYVWLFDENSELVKWLHQCKTYFDFNIENNKDSYTEKSTYGQTPPRNISRLLKSLQGTAAPLPPHEQESADQLLARLEANIAARKASQQQGGDQSVEKNKDPFLYKLLSMCDTGNIEDKFIANQLETSTDIILSFVVDIHNQIYISGFSTLGLDTKNGCLHRYVTCTGPRKLGIGKTIVQYIHQIARDRGYTCVTLDAADSVGFHEKMGYVRTGEGSKQMPEMIYRLEGGKRKTRKKKNKKTRKHRK